MSIEATAVTVLVSAETDSRLAIGAVLLVTSKEGVTETVVVVWNVGFIDRFQAKTYMALSVKIEGDSGASATIVQSGEFGAYINGFLCRFERM